MENQNTTSKNNNNVVIILSYFIWLVGIIVLATGTTYNKDERFQMAQGIMLSLAYNVILISYQILPFSIPFFQTALFVVYLILLIKAVTAIKTNMKNKLPVIGDLTESIFKGLINK